jgi:haloacid dehalogenase-like hydrolase
LTRSIRRDSPSLRALADVAAHERLEAILVFGSKAGLKQRESGEQKRGCAMVYRIVESIFELLSEEECCIAMGNASPDVQAQAKVVTTSNEEEGFANAVEAFIFGENPSVRKAS